MRALDTPLERLLQQLVDASGLAWNDETYDLATASNLDEADRAVYVARLIERSREGDLLAILTLGHLRAPEALPMLQLAGKSRDPWAGTARRALVLYGHGAEVIDQIVDQAVHSPAKMARVAAVTDLPKIGGPKAIAGLSSALADVDSVVRLLAWDGVVAVFGLRSVMVGPEGVLAKGSTLEFLQDHLACDLPSLVKLGVDGMRAMVTRLEAGEDPAALGIAWTPNPAPDIWDDMNAARFDSQARYPAAKIKQLTGEWRRWAEACLAMRLDQATPDVRAAEALVDLRATWALPVLQEVAQSANPELQKRLMRAIHQLLPS